MQFGIGEVIIENFRMFVGKPVKIDLNSIGIGLHFLVGRNEDEPSLDANDVGKSTIWDAVLWCLFGKTARNLHNTDVKAWKATGRTRVQVLVNIDDQSFWIKRQTDPNGAFINGKQVDQSRIERTIGQNFDTFIHTIILPQNGDLFFDLKPRRKLELFSEVLNLNRWDKRSAFASDTAAGLQSDHDLLTGERIGLDNELKQILSLINTVKHQSREWENERIKKLDATDEDLEKARKEFEDIRTKHGEADLALDGAQTELRAVHRQIAQIRTEATKINVKMAEERARNDWEIQQTENELSALGDSDECPTCGQSLKGTDLKKHMDDLRHHIKFLKRKPKVKEWSAEKIRLEELEKQAENLEKAEQKFQDIADRAQSRMVILAPRVGELQAKIFELERAQQERRDVTNPYQDQLFTLRREKSKLYGRQETLEKQLRVLKRRIERTRYWIKGFKDVRLYIVEEALQELDLITNLMLEEVGLHGWKVRYSVEKETQKGSIQRGLNVLILSPKNDRMVKWESWGGGVSQRLRIVGALAFGQVLLNHAGIQSSLEVLDESTKFVAPKGVDDLITFLANRAQNLKKQIILIDHTAINSTKFTSTLTVVKTKHGSLLQ